jgi:hypothetical protein
MSKLPVRKGPSVAVLAVLAAAAGAVVCLSAVRVASAQAAPPPESPYRLHERSELREARDAGDDREEYLEESRDPDAERSLFRFHVGPALLVQPSSPGLMTALDIGKRAVGARVSASWLRAESDQGLASYTAELWVDLARRYEIHPIVGAGASFLRGGALGSHESAGAGVLRGALEYELPLRDADARLSLNLLGLVPAIGSERTRPWLQGGLTIGAGF